MTIKNEMNTSRMTRPIYDIPDDLVDLLKEQHLWEAYKARPSYQQNDYVGWITRAKRLETRRKRIDIMLTELRNGHGYMGMKWNEWSSANRKDNRDDAVMEAVPEKDA